MPIIGPVAARQIQRARQNAQTDLAEARLLAAATGEELQTLAAERGLQPVLRDWETAGDAIQQILLRRGEHVARLDSELANHERERAAEEEELERVTATLDELRSRQHETSEELVQRLAHDETFKLWTQEAAEAEAALERAEASLAEIEHDAMQKLPAYESSRLFQYLYGRQLGTPRYATRGAGQRIELWIGRLIDYANAKTGYEYLKTAPEQVRILLAADRDSLALVMHQLERRRDTEGAQIGLSQLMDRVQEVDQIRAAVLARLEQIRRKIDATRRQLAHIETAPGPYYQKAIEHLDFLLERTEQPILHVQLRQISEPADGGMLARLREVGDQLQNVQSRAAAREQRLDRLNRQLSELGYFQQRFWMAGFDSRWSYFEDSLDLVRELTKVRDDEDSIDLVWQRMRRRQRFGPEATKGSADRRLLGQVLLTAMVHAASPAMTEYARRASSRWTGSHRGGWG